MVRAAAVADDETPLESFLELPPKDSSAERFRGSKKELVFAAGRASLSAASLRILRGAEVDSMLSRFSVATFSTGELVVGMSEPPRLFTRPDRGLTRFSVAAFGACELVVADEGGAGDCPGTMVKS